MFLTQEQIDARISHEDNLINYLGTPRVKLVLPQGKNGGRLPGRKNMTDEEREDCGVLANVAGNGIAAEIFGVHPTTASSLSNGKVAGSEKPELKNAITERVEKYKDQIEERAAERLLAAINFLDDDKLANSKATELSQIAANMSKTLDNVKPRGTGDKGPKVNIFIHQPKQATEDNFEVIEIGA